MSFQVQVTHKVTGEKVYINWTTYEGIPAMQKSLRDTYPSFDYSIAFITQ